MKYSPQYELTFAELQLISSALKSRLGYIEEELDIQKEYKTYYYNKCDKNNATETQNAFNSLNRYKTNIRLLSKEKNKLAEIQRKIKRQLGNRW